MKERLVRGTNVINVVRILRAYEHEHPLPELGTWEKDLLRKRVSRTTWYSLQIFDSLLQIVHRYVFDGSEAAAQNMGRMFARSMIDDDRDHLVFAGKPGESLALMHDLWREHFNFGEVQVSAHTEPESHPAVRVRITGYPDMSACHGHTIIGWSLELTESAGGKQPFVRIEERPWMHNSLLSYTVHWL